MRNAHGPKPLFHASASSAPLRADWRLSCQIASQIKDDAFDLVVCEGGHEPRNWQSTEVWRGPLKWITSTTQAIHLRDPFPLCLPPSDCPWRPAHSCPQWSIPASPRPVATAGWPAPSTPTPRHGAVAQPRWRRAPREAASEPRRAASALWQPHPVAEVRPIGRFGLRSENLAHVQRGVGRRREPALPRELRHQAVSARYAEL
jgi:hypothetical protein